MKTETVTTVNSKTCRSCHVVQPLEDFYHHPTNADGRNYRCKTCIKAVCKDHAKAKRAKRGGSLGSIAVLNALRNGPQSVRQIAFETDYTDSGVHSILVRLERSGYAVKHGDLWRLKEEVAA